MLVHMNSLFKDFSIENYIFLKILTEHHSNTTSNFCIMNIHPSFDSVSMISNIWYTDETRFEIWFGKVGESKKWFQNHFTDHFVFFLKCDDINRVFICSSCSKTSVITKTLEIDSKQTSLPCNAVLNLKLLPTKKVNESWREKNARIACSSESVQTSVCYGNTLIVEFWIVDVRNYIFRYPA